MRLASPGPQPESDRMKAAALALAAFASALPGFAPNLPQHVDLRLIAESTAPKAGHSQFVGLEMTPRPGWHDYWSNPGEAGLAPAVKWTAPAGVRFGPLQHPAPTLLKVQGITSFVHTGPHVLISRMTLDRDLQPGTTLPITAKVSWAACSDKLCVPERATLALQMTIGEGAESADASTIRRAVAAEPKAVGGGAFEVKDGNLVLQLPPSAKLDARRVHFFPDENGFFDAAQARVISASPLRIEAPAKDRVLGRISGVVSDGSESFRLIFEQGELSAPHTGAVRRSPVAADLASAGPGHQETPAPLLHSYPKQHPTHASRVRGAVVVLAALGLSAAAILFTRRKRKERT